MALVARVDDTARGSLAKGQTVVLTDNHVPEIRELLRAAIDDCKWKHDALAEFLIDRGVLCDRYYLSKMLSGEKAITTKHLKALPDDIEARFAKLYAETFGLIVVAPVAEDEAVQQLVTGLVGVLGLLPRKAQKMAKAGL